MHLSANVASARVEFNSREGQRFKNGNRGSADRFDVNRANGVGSSGNVNQGAELKPRCKSEPSQVLEQIKAGI